MKKLVSLVTAIILIIITFASCTQQGSNSKEVSNSSYNLSSSSNIKYQYFFRGFIPLKENQIETYPQGTYIIETDEDWHDFMNKYVPGIPYSTAVDYSKESLVFSVSFPAKPSYSCTEPRPIAKTWGGIISSRAKKPLCSLYKEPIFETVTVPDLISFSVKR